jgi:predicted nucleic acid-binding protein
MIIVSNTSPISNLAAIGQLNLLQKLYDNIIIPITVYQEVIASGQTDPATLAIQNLDWIKIYPTTNETLLKQLQIILDPGEASAITLAVEFNADRLIIDERKGRNEAKKQGLKITGVLGIILAAKEKGFIDLVQPLLDDLMVNGFWLNKSLYHEVLVLANEKNT